VISVGATEAALIATLWFDVTALLSSRHQLTRHASSLTRRPVRIEPRAHRVNVRRLRIEDPHREAPRRVRIEPLPLRGNEPDQTIPLE
jgi:hypothetical protein